MVIRRATKEDGKELLALINALADFEKLRRPNLQARKRLLRDAFGKRKRFTSFLAEINGKSAGYAIVLETYSSFLALPTLYLEDIFVLPEFRKQKVGLRLLLRCVREAQRRGCGRMEWMVLDWNVGAIRFYKKLRARRLDQWLPFRLDRKDFFRLLRRSPGTY